MQSNKASRIQGLKALVGQFSVLKGKLDRANLIHENARQRLEKKRKQIKQQMRGLEETRLVVQTGGKSFLIRQDWNDDPQISNVDVK